MTGWLSALGRHAKVALPLGVAVGLVWPELAQLCRPLLNMAVVGTLTASLLRLDWQRLGQAAVVPRLPLMLGLWQLLVSPCLAFALLWALSAPTWWWPLLVLQAAAPPIGSAAAFALFLGLDGTLALVGTAWMTVALPATLTAVVALLLPHAGIAIDLLPFFARVSLFALLPFALALGIRRWLGVALLQRADQALAGINVLLLLVFAVAVMDGVNALFVSQPLLAVQMLAVGCASVLAWHALGFALFQRCGAQTAFSAALMSGNRNMGLVLAVTAGSAGPSLSHYVGLVQIPMYCAPLLLAPWVARTRAQNS